MKYNTDFRRTEHSKRKIRATLSLDINEIRAPIKRKTFRTSMPIQAISMPIQENLALKYLDTDTAFVENLNTSGSRSVSPMNSTQNS